jgi:transcriptional regulator with XRE-family HTH domain
VKAIFDARAFFVALDAIRESRALTWAEVSRQSEVPSSTMTALEHGNLPSVGSLAKMRCWAGISVDRFFRLEREREDNGSQAG